MEKKVFHELLRVKDALEKILKEVKRLFPEPIGTEEVFVRDSLGRITGEPVFARRSSPYFHSAAMDGYAVRAESTFGASEDEPVKLKLGTDAVWIETGDPLPEEFNAVIPVEEVTRLEDEIEVYRSYPPYYDVRTIGEDVVATELILPENWVITPIEVGAMLASGVNKVRVREKPKVTIIPTGSELVSPEEAEEKGLTPPQLLEYNSQVLKGLLLQDFCNPSVHNIVPDDYEELKKAILNSVKLSHIVIVNAGSGYGKEDFTYKVLSDLGKVVVNGVALKPGKPFIMGIVEGVPVFGIPGYPVSTYFTYRLFLRPALEVLLGIRLSQEETVKGILSRKLSSKLGIEEYVRVKVGKVGEKYVVAPAGRGAGLLMSLVRADGFLKIEETSEGLSQGQEVEVTLLKPKKLLENTIVCIGSHDNTLDVLYNFLRKRFPEVNLSSSHVGSMGGIIAVKRGEAHIAGTHLLDEETGEYNIPFVKRLIPEKKVVLMNLVYRVQGFIVKKGNPKGIKDFADLKREDVVFINRQAGSGTRLLLDKYLKEKGILPEEVNGYQAEEYTHMGVAQAVASGRADVGLGILAAAKALNLDFVPIAEERYDILIPKEFLDLPSIKALLFVIREDQEFRKAVEALGGYDTRDMGKVIFEN